MAPDDPTPDDVDDPEAELLPDDPSDGLVPETPRVPDTSQNDAPPELKKQFWSLVLLFNVALFGMSLGAMLVGFEGRWRVGGAIFAVGAFAFARGWLGYREATSDGDSDKEGDAVLDASDAPADAEEGDDGTDAPGTDADEGDADGPTDAGARKD